MEVLVIAAHPDDEAYGPGGTIARLSSEGHVVKLIVLADGDSSRENSYKHKDTDKLDWLRESCKLLGINQYNYLCLPDQQLDSFTIKTLADSITGAANFLDCKPDMVITHCLSDLNRDHRLVAEASLVAFRPKPGSTVRTLLMYETVSSTEWAFGQFGGFIPNYFVNTTQFFSVKERAIACYHNELELTPHPRSIDNTFNLNSYRGSSVGLSIAEAFINVFTIY